MVCKFLLLGLWATLLISGYECLPAPLPAGDNGDDSNPGMGYGSPYGSFGYPYYGYNPFFGGSFGPPGGPQGGGGLPYGMSFSPFARFGPYGAMGSGFGGGPMYGPPANKIPPGKTIGPPPHVFAGKFPFWAQPGYTGPQPMGPQ